MEVVTWDGGRVATRDSVAIARPTSGARLRDSYVESISALTFGLIRFRGDTLVLGPIELLRFGRPSVTRTAVDWPIEGGLLSRKPGGHWRIQSSGGRVEASVTGYVPKWSATCMSISCSHACICSGYAGAS